MISLDAPQPPPYPSIWLFLPRVVFHWASDPPGAGLLVCYPLETVTSSRPSGSWRVAWMRSEDGGYMETIPAKDIPWYSGQA